MYLKLLFTLFLIPKSETPLKRACVVCKLYKTWAIFQNRFFNVFSKAVYNYSFNNLVFLINVCLKAEMYFERLIYNLVCSICRLCARYMLSRVINLLSCALDLLVICWAIYQHVRACKFFNGKIVCVVFLIFHAIYSWWITSMPYRVDELPKTSTAFLIVCRYDFQYLVY